MAALTAPDSHLHLPLNDGTLGTLPPTVTRPDYDRSALTTGIVHIGVGGFHRAHQAVYLDDLAALGVTDWALTGVGLNRPQMGQVLSDQDGLYLVVERASDADRARTIGAMRRYLFGPDDPEAVLDALCDPATVS